MFPNFKMHHVSFSSIFKHLAADIRKSKLKINKDSNFFLCSTVSSFAARPKSPNRSSMFSLTKKLPERDKNHLSSQHSTDNMCVPKVPADSWDAFVSEHISVVRWPTQFEISVQDTSAVEVFEAGYDLSEVISHFWLCECMSGLPDVCQGLQGQRNQLTINLTSISGTVQKCYICHTF